MVKTTINDEWKQYIYKQIERGVNKKQLQDILENEKFYLRNFMKQQNQSRQLHSKKATV